MDKDQAQLVEDIELLSTYIADGYTKAVLKRAAETIRQLAADVAPVRHGRWIPHVETLETTVLTASRVYEKGDAVQYGFVCSKCGRWEENREPFCNCGAKMEGKRMSLLHLYNEKTCEGHFCLKDCDRCPWAGKVMEAMEEEEEEDGKNPL